MNAPNNSIVLPGSIAVPTVNPQLLVSAKSAHELAECFATIDDDDTAQLATNELQGIKGQIKALETEQDKITRPIREGLENARNFFRAPLEYLRGAETTIKGGLSRYLTALEAKRAEVERVARIERDRQQRLAEQVAAKARVDADAEAAKVRAEAAARAEEAAQAGSAEDAAAIREQADQEAEQIRAQAQVVVPISMAVAPVAAAPKLAGTSGRDNYKAEVYDLAALVVSVAADLARGDRSSLPLLTGDMKVIGQQARSLKGEFRRVGVRVWSEKIISSSAGGVS